MLNLLYHNDHKYLRSIKMVKKSTEEAALYFYSSGYNLNVKD